MKIGAAQIASLKGRIGENVEKHVQFSKLAASRGAELIVFPELSLTGYEPGLAEQLASTQDDPRLDTLQKTSDNNDITICAGLPIKTSNLPMIGMVILSPCNPRRTYCKQYLHSDELPYFSQGKVDLRIDRGNLRIAPAICYESLLGKHAENAFRNAANIYFASVAKSAHGIQMAYAHFPVIAKKYAMPILMSNTVGPSNNFNGAGGSAVWDEKGGCLLQLGKDEEGLLFFDTETDEVETVVGMKLRDATADDLKPITDLIIVNE